MKVFIDLFSGLGGASAAFDADPTWHTIKIDNNAELIEHNRNLIVHDIADVPGTLAIIRAILDSWDSLVCMSPKLIVWASPPCQQFSFANANRNEDQFDLTLLDATRQIIEELNPDHWVIENVHGAKETFTDELSAAPTQEIGSVVLWGNFPLIPIRTRDSFSHKKLDAKGSRSLRPNYRALIPYAISEGLRDSIDKQTTLTSFSSSDVPGA